MTGLCLLAKAALLLACARFGGALAWYAMKAWGWVA
jgi:hypothetical protein